MSSSWTSSIVNGKSPKNGRYENIFSVQRHESKNGRIGQHHNHGSVSTFASTLSSPKSKPPAPTDWIIIEEYPTISPNGIDPFRILDNLRKSSSNNGTKSDSDDQTVTKYLDALERLNVTQYNLTLPIALMSLDRQRFPTLSNARKACRQGKIVLRSSVTSESKPSSVTSQHPPPFRKGLVGDRVYPLDCIARRELYKNLPTTKNFSLSSTSYETLGSGFVKSKFQNLHVAYEDDYMAVVVKPAGLLVHPQGKNGGWGRKNNVLNALPYFLNRPPDPSTDGSERSSHTDDETDAETDDSLVLDRPVPVHRLDFATSGLLVAAKTKGASRLLANEFEYRKARKTYTAMVLGVPDATSDCESLTLPSFFGTRDEDDHSSKDEAGSLNAGSFEEREGNEVGLGTSEISGDDFFDGDFSCDEWNLADCFLDNKRASTRWRVLGSYNCSVPIRYNNDNTEKDSAIVGMNVPISVVEMKPKTGRYHQLRRTMAWLYNAPIVGDPVYGTNFIEENFLPDNAELAESRNYRDSLMLCSNEIDIAHPYYNTAPGRLEWEAISKSTKAATKSTNDLSSSSLYESEDGIVRVTAAIQLPKKFTKFISMMERKKENSAPNHKI